MNRAGRITFATMLFLGGYLGIPSRSTAATPVGQLQETWEQILVILKSAHFDSESEIDAFRIKVMQVITPRFDFAEMAKRCLGTHWEGRTREEREEFVEVLAAILARTYIGGIRSYQESTILYTREFNDATSAEVDTRILSNNSKDLLVSYKMHFIGEDWKVYDVIIDHISLIGNYRSQFHRVIRQSSFTELMRVMKEKQQS